MHSDHDTHAAPPTPPQGGFDSSATFAEAVRQLMRTAAEQGVRRLEWCDADYAEWPIGEPEFVATLTRWARVPGRELVMAGVDFEAIRRRQPRFAQWRTDFAHVVSCLLPEERLQDDVPTLWLDQGGGVLRVFDREHWRGRSGLDRVDRQAAREAFDAITQRAVPGFSSTTLGL